MTSRRMPLLVAIFLVMSISSITIVFGQSNTHDVFLPLISRQNNTTFTETISIATINSIEQLSTCSWTGTWSTVWDNESATMQLVQNGNSVSGTYDWDEGIISGTIASNMLTGTWAEAPSYQPDNDAGYIQFTMTSDCNSFNGVWQYGFSGALRNWNGTRIDSPTGPPTGHIASPQNNDTTGTARLFFAAEAQDNSQTGIKHVAFNVFYSGNWHSAGIDTTAPYEVVWQTPNNLSSQQLQFAIHITDNADNQTEFAGGVNRVNFVESLDQSNISENWVPTRAYLNQRSLSNGDVKCSVSSMAMVLAMNGLIASDYSTMAAKADEMYPNVLINGDAYVWKMRNELRNEGAIADYHEDSLSEGWARIKQEVDAGRPVIVRTVHGTVTAAGHILVAVGYREEGTDRRIIAYDPFGRWLGNCCQNNYNLNSTGPTSHMGQWVFYDFSTIFGNSNYLITASNPSVEAILSAALSTPSTPPDQVSGEPETIGTYEGIDIEPGSELFLPLILK